MKEIAFTKHAYKVSGEATDAYYQELPATDLGSLINYIHARRGWLAGSTFLDIGANIGIAAIGMQDVVPEITVHCLEPSRITFDHLQNNIRTNGLVSVLHPHNIAAGPENAEVRFIDMKENLAGGRVGGGEDSYVVQQVTIDDFVESNAIDRVRFIKIDVEGYEIDVLNGATKLIRRDNPVVMYECNPCALAMAKIRLVDFLEGAHKVLGRSIIIQQDGSFLELPTDASSAAAQVLGMMTSEMQVFDLVNRLN